MKKKRVIPGFHLSLGITVVYLSLIVLIPLSTIIIKSAGIGFTEFVETVTNPRVVHSYIVSISTSFIAALINSVFGVMIAWVLVRYQFPFRRILDGFIDLPFALPTAVAGISLTTLYSKNGWIGKGLYSMGISSSFSRFGITVALVFIGIPFVVRSVQPVLEELDKQIEDAALLLGASKFQTFIKVILPELFPAILTGFGLAFSRGLGEYGSVVFIAGNMPMKTETTPFLIMSSLEQYNYGKATAIAVVMLTVSFAILFLINIIQMYANKFHS